MPILAPTITRAILVAGPTLRGMNFSRIAQAVGISIQSWAPTVTMTGVVTGTMGGGVVTGKLTLPTNPAQVGASMALGRLLGPLSPQIATAVGVGVSSALNATAGYQGVSLGAIGADVSKVVNADSATLMAILRTNFQAVGIDGIQATPLAASLSSGIAAMLLLGVGVGVATGASSPSPGTGVSQSHLV